MSTGERELDGSTRRSNSPSPQRPREPAHPPQRRLDERQAPVRLEKTGRGRFSSSSTPSSPSSPSLPLWSEAHLPTVDGIRCAAWMHRTRNWSTRRAFVPLVPVDDLPDDLREQWEATSRPGLRDFILADGPRARALPPLQRGVPAAALRQPPRAAPHRDRPARRRPDHAMPGVHGGRVPAATEDGLTEDLGREARAGDRDGFTEAEVVALDYVPEARDRPPVDRRRRPRRDADQFTPTQIVEINLLAVMCLVGRFSMLCGFEEPPG